MSGKGTVWVTQPSDYMEPKLSASGYGADAPLTVPGVFEETKNKYPEKYALGVKRITKELTPAVRASIFLHYFPVSMQKE
jgi:hypothetical protein